MIGYAIAMVLLVIKVYFINKNFFDSEEHKVGLGIIKNWQENYITDITATSLDNCLPGYELAFNYSWPGTKAFCSCTYTNNLTNITTINIVAGKCNYKVNSS